MDKEPRQENRNPVTVTGCGYEISPDALECVQRNCTEFSGRVFAHDCRPVEFLKSRKTLKYMSKQDRLAVLAAGKALRAAGLEGKDLREDCGVFITVGYIPFLRDDIETICRNSLVDGRFSMARFSGEGLASVHPLLTFACLPNMPAYHISANFDVQGGYLVSYPDTAQLYSALHEACCYLREGLIKYALVGGVADQNNFLVENHYIKTRPNALGLLADAAAFLVLETAQAALERKAAPKVELGELELVLGCNEDNTDDGQAGIELGCAELPLTVAMNTQETTGEFDHFYSGNGVKARSRWRVL